MPARYGSDLIVDLLKVLGIEYVALNPGRVFAHSRFSGNYESGRKTQSEIILCCHEEIAVRWLTATPRRPQDHAGDRAQRRRLAHASMAIYKRLCDRTPIMVMGGTGPMNSTSGALDRLIHTALVQEISCATSQVGRPTFGIEAIPSSMMRAYRIAMSDPRAGLSLLRRDRSESAIEKEIPLPIQAASAPAPLQAETEAIKEAARWLSSAQNPVIVAITLAETTTHLSWSGSPIFCRSRDRPRRAAEFPNTIHSISRAETNNDRNADVILG